MLSALFVAFAVAADCGVTEGFYLDAGCTKAVDPPPYNLTSNPLVVPKGKCVRSLTSGAGTECVSCTPGQTAVMNLFMQGCGVGTGTKATAPEGKCLSNGKYYELISCA